MQGILSLLKAEKKFVAGLALLHILKNDQLGVMRQHVEAKYVFSGYTDCFDLFVPR